MANAKIMVHDGTRWIRNNIFADSGDVAYTPLDSGCKSRRRALRVPAVVAKGGDVAEIEVALMLPCSIEGLQVPTKDHTVAGARTLTGDLPSVCTPG